MMSHKVKFTMFTIRTMALKYSLMFFDLNADIVIVFVIAITVGNKF